MSITLDFYLARAAECRFDAAEAVLVNVRERNLRAAAAWDVMADRAVRHAQKRIDQEAYKAAEALVAASTSAINSAGAAPLHTTGKSR